MKIYTKKRILLDLLEGNVLLSDKFNLATINQAVTTKIHKHSPESWVRINYKTYPRLEKIFLTDKFPKRKVDLIRVLSERRSIRNFTGLPISITNLAYLLRYSCGLVNREVDPNISLRYYPSAGARYPLEIYALVLNDAYRLKSGVYHYNVKDHCLETLLKGNFENWLLKTTGKFKPLTKSSVIFIITAVLDRTRVKYGDRGYRYILLEAGHVAQNLLLLATELKMGSLAVGGYIDSNISELLNLELVKEVPLYMIAVGEYAKT
jgi:SagB-type dehydrogenase family enzyme